MNKLFYILTILSLPIGAIAQEAAPAQAAASSGNFHQEVLLGFVVLTAIVILIAALAMLRAIRTIAQDMDQPKPYVAPEPVRLMEFDEWLEAEKVRKAQPGIWSKILGLRPISEEKDIMLEHEFDGIVELDNPTPAWFMWLFYGTIAFGLVYMVYFHVFDYGKMQEEEYEIEMALAAEEREAYLASSANNIDENSVEENQNADVLAAGKAIYNSNCVACHGDKGQGLVGPNLTDAYWLHGGDVKSIFKTVKYGVPEKGMVPWEKQLTPKQISEVTNFIISLKGSNPANAKAAEGQQEG